MQNYLAVWPLTNAAEDMMEHAGPPERHVILLPSSFRKAYVLELKHSEFQ